MNAGGIDYAERARVLDASGMAGTIARTADQIDHALHDPEFPALPTGAFRRVVVVGMGGSALPVDVLNDAFAGQLRVPVRILRDYTLPHLDDETLLVLSSFSGNTEETLQHLAGTASRPVVALTAGGRLLAEGRDRGMPVIRIPAERESEGFQPRSATAYMVTYLARLLEGTGFLNDVRKVLEPLVPFLRELDVRSDAEEVAAWIGATNPVFYASHAHERSVARVAKIKFNENAKRPAFFNALPESNHNEMIGFSNAATAHALLYLHDPQDDARVARRFQVMRALFEKKGYDHITFHEWAMRGPSRIARVFSALLFADWLSYTVALRDGIDPSPVELVEEFKVDLGDAGAAG